MRHTRSNSIAQLALVLSGFAVATLLLESEGLQAWAQRLEVGSFRADALRLTSALHGTLKPLGFERIRQESLESLDRLGWSDDPARLEEAKKEDSLSPTRMRTGRFGGAGIAAQMPSSLHAGTALPGVNRPVVSDLPRTSVLDALPLIQAGQPRVVALAGDSMMAVGLSNSLMERTAANPNLRVIKAFRSGTGLARPDVFDWMQEYPAMIGDARPDAVIVAIGANDAQGFVENGKVLSYGSAEWVRVYQERTAAFLNLLTQDGAHVVWVGLPPMRSPEYDRKIAEINRIAYTVVSQNPQATWWNPQGLVGDDAGQYREFGAVNGGQTRLRATDGIHLSDQGAMLLVPSLVHWLNAPAEVGQVAHAEPPGTPAREETRRAARR